MDTIKVIVEKDPEGYVGYLTGIKAVVVGEGATYAQALANVKSAVDFYQSNFGDKILKGADDIEHTLKEVTGKSSYTMNFPTDVPRLRVRKTFELLGFKGARTGTDHVLMVRDNADGSKTPLTIPNFQTIKGCTLRTICMLLGIPRYEFSKLYGESEKMIGYLPNRPEGAAEEAPPEKKRYSPRWQPRKP